MLKRLIAAIVDLCLLRRGPQDLPYQPVLTVVLLIAALVVETASATALYGRSIPVSSVVFSGVFQLAAVWVVVRMRKLDARYWQTLLAIAGTSLLFALAVWPLSLAIGPLDPTDTASVAAMSPLLAGALVGLAIWRILVAGHIWQHALDVPLPLGVLVFIAVFMVEVFVQAALFGGAAGQAAGSATAVVSGAGA